MTVLDTVTFLEALFWRTFSKPRCHLRWFLLLRVYDCLDKDLFSFFFSAMCILDVWLDIMLLQSLDVIVAFDINIFPLSKKEIIVMKKQPTCLL